MTLDGTCPIRQHTGDGAYVGRCDAAVHDGVCWRHGVVNDYPRLDDRDIAVADRRFFSGQKAETKVGWGVSGVWCGFALALALAVFLLLLAVLVHVDLTW